MPVLLLDHLITSLSILKGSVHSNSNMAVSTCTAAVHIFQILYARQFFRRFLSRTFTPFVHGNDNCQTGNN